MLNMKMAVLQMYKNLYTTVCFQTHLKVEAKKVPMFTKEQYKVMEAFFYFALTVKWHLFGLD